jgi:hypothetical protein
MEQLEKKMAVLSPHLFQGGRVGAFQLPFRLVADGWPDKLQDQSHIE